MLRLSVLTVAATAATALKDLSAAPDDAADGRYLGHLLPEQDDPSHGSRRKRLWELPHATLCPLVGVCLPLATLRRVLGRVTSHGGHSDDYAVHCAAINECARRTPTAEALQRELELRHAVMLRRFAQAKNTDALARFWRDRAAHDDVAGALWATLSHARCDGALREQVCGDIHMLQHQLGACNRADLHRLNTLGDENLGLRRELAATQERSTRLLAERTAQIDALAVSLMRVRADSMRKDSVIAALNDDLAASQSEVPGLDSRVALRRQAQAQIERISHLEQQVARWKQCAQAEHERVVVAQPVVADTLALPNDDAATEPPAALRDMAVLCVGGRTASVPVYRRLIEVTGGRFAHHDGGEKQGSAQLEASLAAADMVICQTGCVSHDAYWRVKDHCKRTGKRCVFVDNPSASSLARSLRAFQATVNIETP